MDVLTAKMNMVKQQIRSCDVLDERLLNLFMSVSRESFTPANYRAFAYTDTPIPLGHHQVMMPPLLEAKMLHALQVKPTDKVLEIGTGTGYITYLLSQLAHYVYSVDIFPEFTENAADRLKRQHADNVTLQTGNAAQGWEKQQPYDVIVITGALMTLPDTFLKELKIGGRLFAILGKPPTMEATLITRRSEDEWSEERLFETDVPYLLQTSAKQSFVF